jgi:neurexin
MERLTKKALNDAMRKEINVRTVEKDLINSCQGVPTTPKLPISSNRNFPPTLRNHVDIITATIGELLIYVVPTDTFYDPEDQTDLKLTLLNEDRTPLDPSHWLQFDSKNREFYGVPMALNGPKSEERYVLVAEDKSGLTANDALVVEIINPHYRQDYSATFEYQLDMTLEQFQTAATRRKFIERVAQYFNKETNQIAMKSVRKIPSLGRISVTLQNTTLYNEGEGCPKDIEKKIRKLRGMLLLNDGNVQDGIKQALGSEFNVQKINVARVCKFKLSIR